MKPHHTSSARTDHGVFRRLRKWFAARPAHASLAAPGRLALEPLEQRHLLSVGPFPTPLTHVEPVGSLIYSGTVESTFDSPGGSDAWTIDLPAGQTATLVVESAAGLQPVVALSDPSGTLATATATAAGETLVLQTVPINEAATYTITVDAQSETTGTYNARLILGASIEAETHNGPTNDTPATAEDLSAAFTNVDTAQRGAVLGSLPIDTIGEDWYQFTLNDGQSSTLVLNSDTLNHAAAESVTLELYDSNTNLLTIGMPTANADRAIDNFIDQTTDTNETTYYARVTGSAGSYRLVVIKDGHLDLETEDWSGEPTQDATYYSTILGHLSNNEQKLTASDAAPGDSFGYAVSIDGDTAIIGAVGNDDAGSYSGSAYVFHPGLANDPYTVDVKAGDELLITTATPGDTLDPTLELYDPSGTLVGSDDNGASDGRNARLAHTATVSGSYTVKVLAAGDSRGEYVLNISGQTGEGPAFEVVATVPDGSEVLTSIPSQITVDFNDSVLLSSLDPTDLTIDGMEAVAVTVADHDTVVFDLPPATSLDRDNVRIAAGAILDLQGTPIEPFGVDLTLPFPPPVNARAPLGSLIYQSELTGAAIDHPGDTDAFTIDVDPGQTMTVEIANDGWLEATVEIRDSAGNTIAAPPALSYPWHIVTSTARTNPTQPETYTIVASGEFVPQESDYRVELILNGAVEAETFGGHFNDSAATAEDLSDSFIDLGTGQRGAVLGRLSTDTLGEDWYRFTLDDGQSCSLTLTPEMADLELELVDAQGNVVALGMPTGAIQRTIDRFVDPIGDAPESTYYARVIGGEDGVGVVDYSLVVTRDLDFQPKPQDRNSLDGPDITDTGAVLGYLADPTQQKLSADDADHSDLFGGAVAIDLQTAIVGARLDDEAGTSVGAAYILGFDGTEWQQTQKLTASDADEKDWFGHSVAIDGQWAIVGAYHDDDEADDAGAAYLFQFDGQQWQQKQKLTASDAVFSDFFGYDVAIDGNTALVGAYGSSDDGGYSGAAYVFHFDGTTWQQQTKLTAQDADAGDYFGHSVAVENGLAVIGAYRDEDAGTQSGAAYVFRVDGNQWIQQQKLTADDAQSNHAFGSAVEIGGGRVIVSAPGDSEAASAAGASYIFDFDGNQWLLQQKLTASDAQADAGFGRSVSIDGDMVVVGSDRDDDGGGWHSGSAYVFQFDGTGWVETRKLSADDGATDDTFGRSVAVSDDTVLVGAPMNDAGAANTGAVYLFEQISAVPRHRYQVDALAGDQLLITTTTPGDGPGWPNNTLDPVVRLYDPSGTLVGTDTDGAADGRNARLTHTAAMPGTYTIEIEAEGGSRGEYVLSVAGQTIVLPPFEVEATNPANGAALEAVPLQITIDFGDSVAPSSLDASDLTINGTAAAGVSLSDPDTALFDVPSSLADGTVTVQIAAGAILDVQGTPIEAYQFEFTLDTTPPPFEVESTDPADGAVLTSVPLQITVDFGDSVALVSLDASDLTINGMAAADVTLLDPDTAVFDVPAGLADGTVAVQIAAGAILDGQQTPIEPYQFEFTLDTTAPAVEVFTVSTFDNRPAIFGLVDDPQAGVTVVINGYTYGATNHGDGTWSLAQNTISPALTAGTYDVQVTAVDPLGHVGTDTTVDELTIFRGAGIRGTKWLDDNANGQRDAGEPGIAGVTIYLDQNRNGQLDSGEPRTVTLADNPQTEADETGTYLFSGLDAGSYVVAEVVPDGWSEPVAVRNPADTGPTGPRTNDPADLIALDELRADPRFAGLDGSGFAVVVLDSGIDADHLFFGPDSDGDGVADRIVYQWDYLDDDGDATDVDGHGTHVTSVVGSEDSTYTGMAPGVDIISLRVMGGGQQGGFDKIETALQWVVDNAVQYNIVGVNLSLGDGENYNAEQTNFNIADEFATLAEMGVIVAAATGNSRFEHEGQSGMAYPAADPNVLAVGAVFDADIGARQYETPDGEPSAKAFSSGPDRILPITQRTAALPMIFAPGDPITNANFDGEIITFAGTSQATAHVSGIAAVAQQLAVEHLGRRLTVEEFGDLLQTTGVTINDGDDEDDNVAHTGADFARIDVFRVAEAILAMGDLPGKHVLRLGDGEVIEGVDFGNYGGVPVTPLGAVDLMTLSAVEVTPSRQWYELSTTHDALLTVAVTAGSFDGVELLLTDEPPVTGQSVVALATSTLVDDRLRLDYPVAAGETLFLRVTGTGNEVDLTLANLVRQVDAEVQVFGTDGPDQFEFHAGESLQITIGGLPYTFDSAQIDTITFEGGAGDDTAVLYGTTGDESVTLRPSEAVFTGEAFEVTVVQTGDITVHGEGGSDTAALFDSQGNDNFVGSPTYAAMDGDGFFNRVWNFAEVRADADAGGIDVAKFFDSPGNDHYVGATTYNSLSGDGFHNEVWFFEGSHAYATAGGIDEAKFFDSPGDDTYVPTPTYAALFNTDYRDDQMAHGFYNRVKFFEGVHAYATAGGIDTARFYDSTGNDEFVATPTYAALFNMDYEEQYTSGFYNRAKFFEATHAFGTAGGVDVARLYDSPADDTFYADPTHGALFNPTYQEEYTNGFYNRAKYFEAVHAFATAGGHDTAELHDSSADDTFYADPIHGALYNPTYQESYTNGFYNRAKFFEEVTAFGDTGGRDIALLHGSAENDVFQSNPTEAVLSNPTYRQSYTNGFSNRAKAFDEVYATAGEGDDDRAYLEGAPDSIDLLTGEADRIRLTNQTLDILFEATGFDYVKAKATGSGDTKNLPELDLLQFDLELEGPWFDLALEGPWQD